MSTDTNNTQPNVYQDFHLQYIAGEWQSGQDDSVNTDANPYNGDTLVEIQQATSQQLDEAYQAATLAQKSGRKQPQLSVLLFCIKSSVSLISAKTRSSIGSLKNRAALVLKPW